MALRGLAAVNRDIVLEFGRRTQDRIATIDLDATIIESWKREAQPTYQGFTGYQPMLALWVETNVIVADEFRDGNVGAYTRLCRWRKRRLRHCRKRSRSGTFAGIRPATNRN